MPQHVRDDNAYLFSLSGPDPRGLDPSTAPVRLDILPEKAAHAIYGTQFVLSPRLILVLAVDSHTGPWFGSLPGMLTIGYPDGDMKKAECWSWMVGSEGFCYMLQEALRGPVGAASQPTAVSDSWLFGAKQCVLAELEVLLQAQRATM